MRVKVKTKLIMLQMPKSQGCVPSPTAQLRVERGQGLVEQELGRRYNGAEAKTEDN